MSYLAWEETCVLAQLYTPDLAQEQTHVSVWLHTLNLALEQPCTSAQSSMWDHVIQPVGHPMSLEMFAALIDAALEATVINAVSAALLPNFWTYEETQVLDDMVLQARMCLWA